MKSKEMIYQNYRKVELLYNDIYKGYHYYILSLGTHPAAYIEIPKRSILFGKDYDDIYEMGVNLDVHGGLTFSDDTLQIGERTIMRESWFIGWDYAHAYDYYGGYDDRLNEDSKQWTTEEIIEECKKAIEQLLEE